MSFIIFNEFYACHNEFLKPSFFLRSNQPTCSNGNLQFRLNDCDVGEKVCGEIHNL